MPFTYDNIVLNNGSIIATPSGDNDIVNKVYVDTAINSTNSNLSTLEGTVSTIASNQTTDETNISNLQSGAVTLQDNINAINSNIYGTTTPSMGAKIPLSSLATEPVVYAGTWNASTNTPDLTNVTYKIQGNYYVVSTAGTTTLSGISVWNVGDWAIYNGTVWERLDGVPEVTSVAGRTGDVTLTSADITDIPAVYTNFNNMPVNNGGNTVASTATIVIGSDFAVPNTGTGYLHLVETTVMGRDTTASHTTHDTLCFKFKSFIYNDGTTVTIVGQEKTNVQSSTPNTVITNHNGATITYDCNITIVSNNIHMVLTQSGPITTDGTYNTISVAQYSTVTTLQV